MGLHRIAAPVQRYEWPAAGDLAHADIKPLGRFLQPGHRAHGYRQRCSPGAGWEYVPVAVDDHTRLAYVEVLPDQRGATCAAFLQRATAWHWARGITCRRGLSDNGNGYVARRRVAESGCAASKAFPVHSHRLHGTAGPMAHCAARLTLRSV